MAGVNSSQDFLKQTTSSFEKLEGNYFTEGQHTREEFHKHTIVLEHDIPKLEEKFKVMEVYEPPHPHHHRLILQLLHRYHLVLVTTLFLLLYLRLMRAMML